MTLQQLIALRKRLGLSQTAMAEGIGMKLRAYQSMESGESEFGERHGLAAERFALAKAVATGDPMMAPIGVRRDALILAELIVGPLGARQPSPKTAIDVGDDDPMVLEPIELTLL